jgi:hypothetical protein
MNPLPPIHTEIIDELGDTRTPLPMNIIDAIATWKLGNGCIFSVCPRTNDIYILQRVGSVSYERYGWISISEPSAPPSFVWPCPCKSYQTAANAGYDIRIAPSLSTILNYFDQ